MNCGFKKKIVTAEETLLACKLSWLARKDVLSAQQQGKQRIDNTHSNQVKGGRAN